MRCALAPARQAPPTLHDDEPLGGAIGTITTSGRPSSYIPGRPPSDTATIRGEAVITVARRQSSQFADRHTGAGARGPGHADTASSSSPLQAHVPCGARHDGTASGASSRLPGNVASTAALDSLGQSPSRRVIVFSGGIVRQGVINVNGSGQFNGSTRRCRSATPPSRLRVVVYNSARSLLLRRRDHQRSQRRFVSLQNRSGHQRAPPPNRSTSRGGSLLKTSAQASTHLLFVRTTARRRLASSTGNRLSGNGTHSGSSYGKLASDRPSAATTPSMQARPQRGLPSRRQQHTDLNASITAAAG